MIQQVLHSIRVAAIQQCRHYVRGIRQKQQVIGTKKFQEIFHNDESEDFGDLEADFNQLHKTHKQYEKEVKEHQDSVRQWTVKQKYFNEKQPNFLTWTEKQQIRQLHDKDPVEWTIEHLAESFPADAMVIGKIIKSNWQPRSEQRIRQHDLKVMENWKCFRNNEFNDLDLSLRDHLNKFSARVSAQTSSSIQLLDIPKKSTTKSKEFANIISISNNKQRMNKRIENGINADVPMKRIPVADTILHEKIDGKKPITFDQLNIVNNVNEPKSLELSNPSTITENQVKISSNKMDKFNVKKYETSGKQSNDDSLAKLSVPQIRESIYIPRKLYKEGATYKLEDCFYDDDGEFLYRVPGLTGTKP